MWPGLRRAGMCSESTTTFWSSLTAGGVAWRRTKESVSTRTTGLSECAPTTATARLAPHPAMRVATSDVKSGWALVIMRLPTTDPTFRTW